MALPQTEYIINALKILADEQPDLNAVISELEDALAEDNSVGEGV